MTSLQKIRSNILENQTLIISKPSNLFWITGFTGSTGIALISKEKAVFITDERYALQAEEETIPHNFIVQVIKATENIKKYAWNNIEQPSIQEIFFENEISYTEWTEWSSYSNLVKPIGNLLTLLRLTKSSHEINLIKQATKLIDQAFEHVHHLLKPGIKEKEIEIELDFFLKRLNAKFSFDPIVVSGTNSAKPHGKATQKAIEEGDFVTIDAGAKYGGYCSDLTRTFMIGLVSKEKQNLYNAVLEAQLAALDFMKPGVLGKEVDAVAREVLKKHDLDQYFGHGLGHSLGVDTHDGYRLNPTSETILEENQVWTVEPGAYIPGFGGVRIEDDVVMTSTGIEILTQYPK